MFKWFCDLFKKKEAGIPNEVARVWAEYNKSKGTSKDFGNPRWFAEVNLGINSKYPRFFLWDKKTNTLYKYKTSHGSGGSNKSPHNGECREVGNVSGSHLSCLGLFECAETYYGRLGYCLRLDGLDSTNYKARRRAILIHKANYVNDNSSGICGMSWGCFAIDVRHNKFVIDALKNGSPLYAHHNGKLKL